MAKIVAFSTNKGGVLKTSLAINVAGSLATQGKKILIIDMDNQGNISTSFGQDYDQYETTIYDLLTDLTDKHLSNAIVTITPNLDIIAANDDLAYLEIDILTSDW
ncbi:ParA family protein [Lacticaseibacillus paracasei]|uniref:ParA family protein n=1 Tax=Lacticaseibacillus paracasei TaxID=1597 RepID=UPI003D02BF4A